MPNLPAYLAHFLAGFYLLLAIVAIAAAIEALVRARTPRRRRIIAGIGVTATASGH